MTLKKITEEEYALLKVYEKDAKSIMKFLAINHNDVYMDIITKKVVDVEKRLRRLEK